MTLNRPSKVYFKVKSRSNGTWYHAQYSDFSIGPESDGYRIHLDNNSYTGTAGTCTTSILMATKLCHDLDVIVTSNTHLFAQLEPSVPPDRTKQKFRNVFILLLMRPDIVTSQ